jgi:CxxC motif-containing protein
MAIEKVKMICLGCPVGCELTVTHDVPNVIKVEGNQCAIGVKFATSEIQDPRRMIATTVRVKNGVHPLVPVYTASPFPKPLIMKLMEKLREIEVEAPVHMDQVILKDALGTGIDIIASRDLPSVSSNQKVKA